MFKDNNLASLALEIMLNSQNSLYVTGDAGTGKSTLLKHFLENTTKQVAVLAPTGLAAINIGGETIHSFCKFNTEKPWKLIEDDKIHKLRDNRRIKNLDTLVIDEISMVRSDLLDALDIFFRLNRNRPKLAFGGLQLIFFGDHFQLPPVLKKDEKEEFFEKYIGEHFFQAKCFDSLNLNFVKLDHNYRQSESEFIKMLNYLRYGVKSQQLIDWINYKFYQKPVSTKILPITITTINRDALEINNRELDKLPDEAYQYNAVISGKFSEELYPTEKYLAVKPGAQVMFIKNDPEKKWVNGTIAKVHTANKTELIVEINDKLVEVDISYWEAHQYRYDEDKMQIVREVVGEFVQYPIKLAWAVTIHKSQGQTFTNCIIDMGRGAFISGQTYVAFSRCKTLAGIHLTKPIKQSDIITDTRVFNFDRSVSWNIPSPDLKVI